MFFKIIRNIRPLISLLKDLQTGLKTLVSERRIVGSDWKKVFDDLEDLVDSGLIFIPGVDSKTLREVLESIEATLPQ